MKKILLFCASLILAFVVAKPAFTQKLSVGILSGFNFTKPQGYFTSGKWEVKNGPVAGLFVNYEIVKSLSVQTEFDFTIVNYTHKSYSNYYYGYGFMPLSSSYFAPYYYNNPVENWEYTFYRFPLYFKYSSPTKLRLELAMGGYFSIRGKYEIPSYPYSPIYTETIYVRTGAYYNYYDTPPKYDAGFFYSAGLSYPIAEHLNVHLQGRYFAGKRTYIESVSATNGAGELVFGLGYTGLLKDKNKVSKPESDSVSHSLSVTVKNGISFSGNSGSDNNNMYSNATGFATGLSFVYRFSKHFSLQSEVMYETKGYTLKGVSNSYFKYTPGSYYTVDNSVSLGYVTIPLLLNLRFGEKYSVYFNAGMYAAMRTNARCTGIAYSSYSSETGYQLTKINVNDDIDGNIKSNDWGWAMGGGIQYPVLNKYKLDLEVRYTTGNLNIYKQREYYLPNENGDIEIKNRSTIVTLGFQFPLN